MLPPAVQAASPRPTFDPAGAGAILAGVTGACIGVGALIGWSAGSVAYGLAAGAVVGVPAGVAAVVARYRSSL
jgi:hypothetical protein